MTSEQNITKSLSLISPTGVVVSAIAAVNNGYGYMDIKMTTPPLPGRSGSLGRAVGGS